MIRKGIVLVVAALLAGCGIRHQATALNPSPRPMTPKAAAEVHVFTSGRPAQPYHEVLLLQAEEESVYANHDESAVLAALRKRGGQLGCDAIMVLSPSGNIASTGGKYSNTRTLRGFRATCVVYDEPAKVGVASVSGEQAAATGRP